jgi:WD40 repeat protein
MIKSIIAHTDAVTSLSLHPNTYYVTSTGHDGGMRTWDIRKFTCLHDLPVKSYLIYSIKCKTIFLKF